MEARGLQQSVARGSRGRKRCRFHLQPLQAGCPPQPFQEPAMTQRQTARIAIVTVSDRASRGEYEDRSGPAAEAWLHDVVISDMQVTRHVIPDGREGVAATLRKLADGEGADLILISGGTGPAPRDE